MNEKSETYSSSSDSSYVFVDNPAIDIEENNSQSRQNSQLYSHRSDELAIMSLSSTLDAEAGLLPHHSAYYSNEKSRRRHNLCRVKLILRIKIFVHTFLLKPLCFFLALAFIFSIPKKFINGYFFAHNLFLFICFIVVLPKSQNKPRL